MMIKREEGTKEKKKKEGKRKERKKERKRERKIAINSSGEKVRFFLDGLF